MENEMEVGGKGRKLKRDSYGNLLIIIKTKGYLRTYVIATITRHTFGHAWAWTTQSNCGGYRLQQNPQIPANI